MPGAKLGAEQAPIDWTQPDSPDGGPDKTPGQRTGATWLDNFLRPLNPQVPGSSPGGRTNKTPGQRLDRAADQ